MTTFPDDIEVDQFIARPPAAVWTALTTPDGIASWWAPGDIAAVVGHRFLLDMPGWGGVPCEVLEADEPTRFAHTFGDWTISWTLVPEGDGTRVLVVHSGFDPDRPQDRFAFDNMGPGWRDEVLPRFAAAVEAATA
ncbi:SRPBCC family protein [Dermatobacter hominis]|uniref:SRPBCC family protein n=1 Tax=Dermatobacter hominis TaxID=2884263 RepID=UPI001D129C4C|nr:SRPBCC domain-containing protein [Dermatobacter hominis]UDY37773.1 SRPBCC domain-containing protein [Dermatobacter hominis]